MASGTSKGTEIKLTNVARASLEELLEDYRDFMRDHDIAEWERDHPYARRLSELNRDPDADYETFRAAVEHKEPARAGIKLRGAKIPEVPFYHPVKRAKALFSAKIIYASLSAKVTETRSFLPLRASVSPW